MTADCFAARNVAFNFLSLMAQIPLVKLKVKCVQSVTAIFETNI